MISGPLAAHDEKSRSVYPWRPRFEPKVRTMNSDKPLRRPSMRRGTSGRETSWPRASWPGASWRETSWQSSWVSLPLVAFTAVIALFQLPDSAQAGRWLPEVENPYCPIKTYRLRGVAEQASSMTDRLGRPIIIVSSHLLRGRPAYSKFLLAHECCHHTLGHVAKFRKGLGHVGPQAFFYIAPELKRMELEADCCAVTLLRERNDMDGIEAGAAAMSEFGDRPTGAHYPTGIERAEKISSCARLDP